MTRITTFLRNSVSAAALFVATGCGGTAGGSSNSRGEYAQAGLVAGIAVTAALIQAARGSAKPLQKGDICCTVCDKCSFPCGDSCLLTGSICFKPIGCACYDSQLPSDNRPPESDLPCATHPGDPNSDTVVVPMGSVAF